ncbi:MAG: zinc-binding dehydrogenase [Methanomicrobiales archaeon]|jgi:threonine dehydrogenase-like Zn-dependent dehydrogenase|nr:zinc-binding dehydrogenase [Methanomicrobiales archaeon]
MKGFGVIKKGTVGWLEKPDPICGPSDAIARPIALAPCTSDVHSAYEMEGPHLINRILGHESIGELIEVGSEVRDFQIGDRVVIPCTTPSWSYPSIQDGMHQHEAGLVSGINFSSYEDGTLCDRIKIRSADMNLAMLPANLNPETAVMITDMMTTGFHGAELAEVKFGDSVCVMGIGPVGLMAVAGSALSGAGQLLAVGTRPDCVTLAKEYGATDIISYKEGSIYDQVMDATDGNGVDAVIVAGGDLETFYTAFGICKNGGHVANINVFTEITSFNIPIEHSGGGWMGHKTFRGGLCPGGRRRMERLISIVQAGRVDPGRMITHRFHGMDSIPEAFQLMVEKPRDLIKPVVILD